MLGYFNRLYTDQTKLLSEYKQRLEREKFTEFEQGRIVMLDEEVKSLIQQERALILIEEKGYVDSNFTRTEHEQLISQLIKLQTERAGLVGELTKKDSRIAKTLELEGIIKAQGGIITEFNEDLYSRIIEKIVVKERTKLVFHLKNGLCFEEHYTLKRSRDLI